MLIAVLREPFYYGGWLEADFWPILLSALIKCFLWVNKSIFFFWLNEKNGMLNILCHLVKGVSTDQEQTTNNMASHPRSFTQRIPTMV